MVGYRDSFGQPMWVRVLTASFRLGRFFGVEVRVYWLALLLMPLLFLSSFSRWGVLNGLEVLVLSVASTAVLYLVTWSHEMGHVFAGRRYNIRTPLITLSPIGGLAHMSSAAPNPRADAFVSLAGPAVHLAWLAVFWPLSSIVEPAEGFIRLTGWFLVELLVGLNLWMLVFNLLPFFPMDGGRVLRAVLAGRMHPNRASQIAAKVGMVGAGLLLVWAFAKPPFAAGILVGIAISNYFACRQELTLSRYGEVYSRSRLEPWQVDPDAWKSGTMWDDDRVMTPKPRKVGMVKRWQERRRRREEEARVQQAAQDEAEMDRILDRINQIGLPGLSAQERATLERVAKARREARQR